MGVRIYNARGITSNIKFSKNLPDLLDDYAPSLPQEPVYDLPTWTTTGDLGSFQGNDEVAITLEYHDPSDVVEDFTISGVLPSGVSFNDVGGTISGFIDDVTSTEYNFTITMNTIHGDEITESFSMNSVITSVEIVWETDENLGEYDSGQTVSQGISASTEETTV